MKRLLRHATFIASIVACVWLAAISWMEGFTPGRAHEAFPVLGFVFSLAAVVLTLLWRTTPSP